MMNSSTRQSLITIILTGIVVVFFLGLTVLITGGYIIYVILAVAGIALFGGIHYVLWGKMLSEQVAGEREEEQLRRRAMEE